MSPKLTDLIACLVLGWSLSGLIGGGAGSAPMIPFPDKPTQAVADAAHSATTKVTDHEDRCLLACFYRDMGNYVEKSEPLKTFGQFRKFNNAALLGFSTANDLKGKYAGLDVDIDSFLVSRVGKMEGPLDPKRKELADSLRALSWGFSQ